MPEYVAAAAAFGYRLNLFGAHPFGKSITITIDPTDETLPSSTWTDETLP